MTITASNSDTDNVRKVYVMAPAQTTWHEVYTQKTFTEPGTYKVQYYAPAYHHYPNGDNTVAYTVTVQDELSAGAVVPATTQRSACRATCSASQTQRVRNGRHARTL